MTAVAGGATRRPAAPRRPLIARLLATEGVPILLVLIVVLVVLMALAPNAFLGWRTYISVLINYQPQIICALGLTLVIASGEIDLSFPSVITLTSMLFAAFYRFDNVFWLNWLAEDRTPEEIKAMQAQLCWLGVVAALGVGAFVGFINGVLVARIGIPSIIATLATAFVWRGMAVFLAGGKQFSLRDFNQTDLWAVTTGRLFTGLFGSGVVLRKPDGIPIQAVVVLALAVLLWFILNRHRFGEHLLFIGDNVSVARVVGVNVGREKIKLFTLMGVLGAFAAVLLTAENKNFFNTQGSGFLLTVMAAVFIGGTSIFGGKATIVGSYVGAYIIGMIEAGLVATGMQGFWVRAVVGLVFLAAVVFHLTMEEPARLRRLLLAGRLNRGTAPPAQESP